MVDTRVANPAVRKNSLKSSLTKPFKSRKVGLLKQNVAELQNKLKKTEDELTKSRNDVTVIRKEIKDLQSTYDDMKIENATNIDDLMEKLMEAQMARAQEKKRSEEKIEVLKAEYEEMMMTIEMEGDCKLEELRKELTEQMEAFQTSCMKQRDEIVAVRDKLIEEKDEEIAKLEKERRSVKKMGMRACKAMKKNMFGPSQKEKMRIAERNSKKASTDEELSKSIQNMQVTETIELPFPTPLFDDSNETEEQKNDVIIELAGDFTAREMNISESDDDESGEGIEDNFSDHCVGQNITEFIGAAPKDETHYLNVDTNNEVSGPKEVTPTKSYEGERTRDTEDSTEAKEGASEDDTRAAEEETVTVASKTTDITPEERKILEKLLSKESSVEEIEPDTEIPFSVTIKEKS